MKDRFRKWVLISGHRYRLGGGLVVLMTGVVVIPLFGGFAIRNTSPLSFLGSTLAGGNVTLITVVVAIDQVILSQELEPPGSLQDEIERTAQYRQAALEGQPPPTKPSTFLEQLLQQILGRVRSLEGLLPESDDGARDELLTGLPTQCERVADEVEPTTNDLSNVLFPLLDIDHVDYIHTCRQLQSRYSDDGHDRLKSTLDDLTTDLENLDVARQYFATAYMKEELATLSRSLLYVGIVAVSLPLALLFRIATYSTATPPTPALFTYSVLAVVVGLMPIALLIAFILRIATVARRIAGITPFKV